MFFACTVALPLVSCSRDDALVAWRATVLAAPTTPASAPWADTVVSENTEGEDTTLHYVGRLPRPLPYFHNHGRELYALLQGKPWHGHIRTRHCAGCAPGESAIMKIEAISNTHHDSLTGLPPNGVVVGRMMNIGRTRDLGTSIEPDGWFTRTEYYFIITDRSNAARANLYVARIRINRIFGAQQDVRIERAREDFVKCPNHLEPPRTTSDGDFRDCPGGSRPFLHAPGKPRASETPTTGQPVTRLTFASRPLAPEAEPPAEADASAWFACDGGCCTAKWPPSVDSSLIAMALQGRHPWQ